MIYLFCILILILSFISSVLLYVKTVSFARNNLKINKIDAFSFIVPVLVCAPLFFAVLYFLSKAEDSLFDISYFSLSAIMLSALAVGFCSINEKAEKFSPLVLAASCCICSYILPTETIFYDMDNATIQKFLIAAIWFIVACSHLVLVRTDGLLSVHTLMICLCMFIFYILSGISSIVLLYAATIAGIASAYGILNYPPAQLIMNKASTLSFGFLVGFIILCCCAEGLFMSTMIILSYVMVLVMAFVFEKFILRQDINEITSQKQCLRCARVIFILLFIAIMQMFVESTPALFMFALLFSMWATGKMGIEHTNQSFIEINKEVFSNLKNGLKELGDLWSKKK